MNEDLVAIPMIFGTISWIAWLIFSTIRRYKATKVQGEIQARLLDKFGSSQELLAYVQSETGKQFLDSLTVEQRTPYGRILNAAQSATVMIFFGGALLFLRGRISAGQEVFLVFGTLILTLGIGFAVSAAVSYSLSKSFGLVEKPSAHRP
jgi:hypothetical protein